MKRRILSCLLAALLLFGAAAAPQQVLAAGTLTISSVSGARGEVVEVSVALKSDDVYSGSFEIRYDSAALEFVESRTALPACFINEAEKGTVSVSLASAAETISDAVLCTLTFRITADTPAGGSEVTVGRVRLYTKGGVRTEAEFTAGSVARKIARLSLENSETAAHQAVGVTVRLEGGLRAAGGNFTFAYDPACLTVGSVQALDGLKGAAMSYHVIKPGVLRVSFSAVQAVPDGELCTVILQTKTAVPQESGVRLTDVRLYDERAVLLDAEAADGTVRVNVPSDRAPKLWVVGGALQSDGTAAAAVVFQGRGAACGGNLTLCFDPEMTATVSSPCGAQVVQQEAGKIMISWSSVLPYDGEQQLLTVSFANAAEGKRLELNAVRVYDEQGKDMVTDVRPAVIGARERVTAAIDEKNCSVEESASGKRYTVAVDVADLRHFSGETVSSLAPMLALYEDGRLVAMTIAEESALHGGVSELSLAAETKENVTAVRVFLLEAGGGYSPLCAALSARGE